MSQDNPARSPDLPHTIYRAANWARLALAGHLLVVNLMRVTAARHPIGLLAISVLLLGWSTVAFRRTQRPVHRTSGFMAVDMTITMLAVASSRLILGIDLLRESYLGVAVYWILAAPTTIAIWRGARFGLGCGLCLAAVEFLQAPGLQPRAWSDGLLMVAIPCFVGALVYQLNTTIADRDRSFATAAALEERERLNRIVHDGVLQVLAMVAREGNELGPRGKMLAVLARKQEDQLRTTLQDRHVDVAGGGFLDASVTDITTMLEKHQSRTITVSTMAGQVHMASARAKELDAVIVEVLSNVFKHAGVDARAWILLEQEGNELIISVRDDGVGMSKQQLEAAANAGRMGVKESIVGRIIDLGGTSTLHSAPGEGTEWEFRVPLE